MKFEALTTFIEATNPKTLSETIVVKMQLN